MPVPGAVSLINLSIQSCNYPTIFLKSLVCCLSGYLHVLLTSYCSCSLFRTQYGAKWQPRPSGLLSQRRWAILDADGSQEVMGSLEACGRLESWQKHHQPPALPAGGTQKRARKACLARGASGISALMQSLESSPQSHQEPFLSGSLSQWFPSPRFL